ncbi:MAG: TonB-dependent receptor [Aestuariibacter sp.]
MPEVNKKPLLPLAILTNRKTPLSAYRAVGKLSCALSMGLLFVANVDAETQQTQRFNIGQQPADQALIEFAAQANLMVVFPYSKVKDSVANAVHGQYVPEQAIRMLLLGTDLQAQITEDGQIKVSEKLFDPPKPKSFLSKVIDFFGGDNERLIKVDPENENSVYEQITVRGYRASLRQTVGTKREADGVVDNIQAVDIGKFPDQNLAEALQRVAGVSIDRAEGEGQYVTVRGFGPEFNRVLVNDRQIATDNLGREFSFDTLASELVSGVSIYKTSTASMQAGGIGSVINIETARPLSMPHFQFIGNVKYQYDSNSLQFTPQGTVLFSNTYFDNRFGILASINYQRRQARIDEAQIDGWLLNTDIPEEQLERQSDNIFVPRNYDQRVRFDDRTRLGQTLVLQYRPNEQLEVIVDGMQSDLDIKTNATSMGHWFTSSNLENVVTDSNGSVVEFQQRIGHATDFHARTFDRPSNVKLYGVRLNYTDSRPINWKLDWSKSTARIDDTTGNANALSLIGYLNRSQFDHNNSDILPHISGFETAAPNIIDAMGNPSGVSHYLNPSNGRAHVMLRRGWDITDTVQQMQLGGVYHGEVEGISEIRFGLDFTQQRKNNVRVDNEANAAHCRFCGYFDQPDIPDDFQSIFSAGDNFLNSISGHRFIPKQWLQHNGQQLFDFLEQQSDVSLEAVQRGNSFEVQEDVYAAYIDTVLSYDWRDVALTSHLGLRYEYTDVSVQGFNEQLLSLVILDQTELGQVTGETVRTEQRNHYDNWLPNAGLKLEFLNDWVLRFGYSKSFTRPTMSQLSPGISLDTTRQGGDLRASSGNASLMPFESSNFDVSAEYFYRSNSYLSASYFRKQVKNFISTETNTWVFPGVTDPSTGNDPLLPDDNDQLAEFDIVQPVNGEKAVVDGIELSWSHQFGRSGFGYIGNLTLVESNAELDVADVNRKFALTGLSNSKNFILYYEKGNWQWRLAWNYRDGFLQSQVQKQSAEPTFVAPYEQYDFAASYNINNKVSVYFEAINLTNETVHKHGRFGNQLLLVQDTGSRYSIGLRGNL